MLLLPVDVPIFNGTKETVLDININRVKGHGPTLFTEGDTVMSPHFLPENVYEEAMRGMIVVCADAVIVGEGKLWLAKRNVEPQPKIWMMGGRRPVGMTARDAIAKIWLRETRLELPPGRFTHVLNTEYLWATRAQSPQDTPCHVSTSIFAVSMSNHDMSLVARNLAPTEYDTSFGLRPFGMMNLEEHEDTHPVLIDLARALGISIS